MKKIILPLNHAHQFTDRLVRIAFLLMAMAVPASTIHAQQASKVPSVNLTTIHQEINFKATPKRLYEALLSTKDFSELTSLSSQIDPTAGGAFTLFEKNITGRNIELVPNQRIVQAWRSESWPIGIYSIAKFEFKPEGTGVKLIFDHIGFPVEERDHLAAGWQTNYWNLLTKYFK